MFGMSVSLGCGFSMGLPMVVGNRRIYEQRITDPESVPDHSHNRRGHTTFHPGDCNSVENGKITAPLKFTSYYKEKKERLMSAKTEVTRSGITFGSALAITISWSVNKSIIWAIIHGLFSWLYVIYYSLKYHYI